MSEFEEREADCYVAFESQAYSEEDRSLNFAR